MFHRSSNPKINKKIISGQSSLATRVIFSIVVCCFAFKSSGQNYSVPDTVRKNEFSLNLLPFIAVFSGYQQSEILANFGISYKRYMKKQNVFRSSLLVFPGRQGNFNNEQYEKTIDTLSFFSDYSSRQGTKTQLNIGFEKLFLPGRLTMGAGAELLLNFQNNNYRREYLWYPTRLSINDPERLNYSPHGSLIGKIDNSVDSLSYICTVQRKGIGLQVFYSLRYRLNEHFYMSTTVGPYLILMHSQLIFHDGNRSLVQQSTGFNLDAMIMIWDISIAFRFGK